MVIIISGGIIKDYNKLKPYFCNAEFIICADGGIRHARALEVIPNVIIGDMDSAGTELLKYYHDKNVAVYHYPKDKDEVDTQLAIQKAVEMGFREILLLGATGGRVDHTIANMHLLVMAANMGVKAVIIDEQHHISLVTPEMPAVINNSFGVAVSLLPLTSEVVGVNSCGLKWELTGGRFTIGNPYGVSNQLTESSATISVKEGILVIIEVKWE